MPQISVLQWTGKNDKQVIDFIKGFLTKEYVVFKDSMVEKEISDIKTLTVSFAIELLVKKTYNFELGTCVTVVEHDDGEISIFQTHPSDINFLN
ncbi:MAG: hypothetical protein EOL97_15205 [Spirochaetia bacterium]|nr:hypothetical protein [Spirochaetia bacterium]